MWARLLAFCSRLGFAWARQRLDDEAHRELETHLDLLTERYSRAGMSPDAARVSARQQLGNAAIVREDIYRMNGIQWADGLAQDGRYALRQMRRAPIFAAVVIATLAIGIGGTTAVFSVVHAVLLAPLPYAEPERLVRLYQQQPGDPSSRYYLTGPYFTALRDHTASFDAVAASNTYSETGLDLVKDGHVQRIRVLQVTSGYFRTVEAGLLRGPGFELRDETGTDRVVLSDALWRSRFGGDLSVIGSTVQLSGESYEVAGVAPGGLEDPVAGEIDAWVPNNLSRNTGADNYSLTAVGRLKNGVTPEQAQTELATLSSTLTQRYPSVSRSALVIVPLQVDMVAASRGPLQLVLVAVALVLLVACVNVANLALVRATGRLQEFAIRSAMGSGRAKLVRQLLVENLILAGIGGVTGVVLAMLGVRILRHLGRDAIPRLDAVGFDGTVLGFALVVTVATSLTFGIAPALRLARVPPSQALRQQSRSASGTRNQGRLRSALAAAQLALALTLLAGAGVLLASLYRLQHVSLGFRVDSALTFEVHLPTARYGVERRAAFHEDLARRIQSIPGVVAAGGTSRLPGTGSFHPWPTRIETGPLAGENLSRSDGIVMQQRTVSGEIFRALDVPLLAGRTFDDRDTSSAPKVAVVSAGFARRAFPGLPLDAAIGQRIAVFGNKRQIVGVVGDVTTDIYGARSLAVYHAHRQFADNRNWALSQVVATDLPPDRIVPAVRAAVAAIDPELIVHRPAALSEVVGRGLARERFAMVLMGAFAVVALLLASLGLYGVLAYAVRQRTLEIGIRMALGATAAQVRAVVLRQAAVVLGAGLVAGTAGALIIGRWLSSLVFETSPSDPRILVATAVLLTVTGLIAAWLPARRAARVEPRIAIQDS